MGGCVPVPVQPLIDAYLRALEPLRAHFYGIYISGSIALDAFEELKSNIDIIALTQGEWSPSRTQATQSATYAPHQGLSAWQGSRRALRAPALSWSRASRQRERSDRSLSRRA